METRFAHLEVLMMSMASTMVAQVKPIAPTLGDSLALDFSMELDSQGPLGPNEIEWVFPMIMF
jgi:hypothetical protein